MGEVSSEIFENSKLLFKEMGNFSFLLKIIILFIVYLFSNYIFDRINNEDLIRTFAENPTINIQLPNNTTFKMLITICMIISSHFIYNFLVKPFIYPNKLTK